MSILRRLKPDVTFAAALDGKVEVHTSATQSHTIRAYKYGKQPNKGLGDEFILIRQNGAVRSRTKPLGCFLGNLAVEIRCKLQTNNTSKDNIVDEILGQVEDAANSKTHGEYFYEIEADNVITPTTPNLTDGYSTTVINVKWHTTDKFNTNNLT